MTHSDVYVGDIGAFPIDDREKNGADRFDGKLITFGSERHSDWSAARPDQTCHLAAAKCSCGLPHPDCRTHWVVPSGDTM